MLVAVLFIIARRWKQPKCPSTDKWINKIFPTRKYYLTIKRNEILMHNKTWMNVEKIILSERSQSQKITYLHNFFHIKYPEQEYTYIVD